MARSARWPELTARRPSPPLLRPPRRSMRPVLLALLLTLAGVIAGMVVGLGLRPPTVPGPDAPATTAAVPAPQAVPPQPAPPEPVPAASTAMAGAQLAAMEAQLATLRRTLEQERARLDALTRARAQAEAEKQARQEAQARARAAAEAQLAALQRDIAAAQREAAPRRDTALLPPVAAPSATCQPRPESPAQAGAARVYVHHRAGSPSAAEAAAAVTGALREGGFEVPEVRASAAVPSQRVVRYFYAEDAPAAARLAGRLGRGWAIQDFRGYEPSPSPGTLEVWVPDR